MSTPDYPKHLLTIVGKKSLLQNTFERAKRVTSVDKIYISTEASHSDHVASQLPELTKEQIIVEPARRDTMPCILNAVQLISSKHGQDEPIASIHADHVIRDIDGFIQAIKVAGQTAQKHQRIVLLGVEPTLPATKYGYIQKGPVYNGEEFVYKISSFKEKPEYKLARQYFEDGDYLWNMGYFVAPYSVFEKEIKQYASDHWAQQITRLMAAKTGQQRDEIYHDFKKEAIDTALMEKVPNLLVMPGNFDWMDVGSFDDVHRVSPQEENGNSINGNKVHVIDSEQVYVRNECDRPVAVIGVDNIVIVNTEHGVLVMRTDQAQKVKIIANKLRGQE